MKMTANSPRARKTKGQEFQKKIAKILRKHYGFDKDLDSCFEGEIQANPMGMKGTDIRLSPVAKKTIQFNIEAKRQEKLNIWSALKQAESNTEKGRIPLLVFKRNHSEIYCCLKFSDFLKKICEGNT